MIPQPRLYARQPVLLPDVSCAAFLLESAASMPDRSAFFENGRRWTHRELHAAVGGAFHVLAGAGVAQGNRVAVSLPTGADYFIWALAVLLRGGVVVPVYDNAPAAEFTGRLSAAGARHAVVASQAVSSRSVGLGKDIQVVDADGWRDSAPRAIDPAPIRSDDPAFLFFSSGSTGEPKAIPLTHRNILAGRLLFAQATLLDPQDILVHFLPPVHVYGWMAVTAAIGAGSAVVLHRRYDFDAIVNDVTKYRATAIFGVPRLIVDLAQIANDRIGFMASLRFVNTGSSPLAAEIMQEMRSRTGIAVTCGYGLTEAAPTSHSPVDQPDLIDLGTVGCPVSLTQVRLVDPTDPYRPLPRGTPGELVISGPQVATGYLRTDGTLDRSAWLEDGAFRTGDLVEIDDAGRLRIVGRLKSLIKYNGYSIVPAELEAHLASHPDVLDCVVLGRPDPAAGEVPIAFVVSRTRDRASAEDLLAYVRSTVSAQRSPRELIFVDAIPRSEAGKVVAGELLVLAKE